MKDETTNALIVRAASAITYLASGNIEEARYVFATLAQDLTPSPQEALPGIPGPSPQPKADHTAIVRRLFAYWQTACKHPTAKLTPDRIQKVVARLREGYAEPDIRKAIDGASASAFTNDAGHTFDDLALICQSGSKLESFITRGVKATGDITVEIGSGSPIEDQIAELRARMSALARDGRKTEYEEATKQLRELMAKRKVTA